jgi:molybdopterin converting factor small subunit
MEKNIEVFFHHISNLQKINHLTRAADIKGLFVELKEKFGLQFEMDELCMVCNSDLIQDQTRLISDRDIVEIFPPYAGG